jgi:hypothetical protein
VRPAATMTMFSLMGVESSLGCGGGMGMPDAPGARCDVWKGV